MSDDAEERAEVTVDDGLTHFEKAFEVVVAGHTIAGESTQPRAKATISDDLIPPPLPPESLAALSTVSGTRSSCIEAVARNTVGLGMSAVLRDGDGTPSDDEKTKIAELLKVLNALSRRDRRLDRPAFLDLLFAVKTDEEECGQGMLEVSRNATNGQIDGLFHLPGKRMRRKRDRTGWRLLAGGFPGDAGDPVDYYNFGEKMEYDEQGKLTGDLASGKSKDVNEVLVFRLYSSESRDYGMPRDAAIALEYAAEKLAAEGNVSFFDASGVPPTIIFVSGDTKDSNGQSVTVRVPQQTVDRVARTVKSDAGHQRTVAIVPLPAGTDVKEVTLGQRSDRDIGNVQFRSAISSRVRSAFRLGSIFVADDGGFDHREADAQVQRALGLEQVFDPEQVRYEGLLDMLLDELGYDHLRLKFKRLAVEADEARRTSANDAAQVSAITNREYRAAHGLGPLPESDTADEEKAAEQGKMPKGWNERIVTAPKGGGGASGDARAFGGRNGSDPMARKDNSGRQPGIGQRRPTPAPGGTSDPQLQKEHGVDHVDFVAHDLEVTYLDISGDSVTEAMKRTHSVAQVIAGEVAEVLGEREAARAGA